MHPFSTHWKHQKTVKSSYVSKWYRKSALRKNALNKMEKVQKIKNPHFFVIERMSMEGVDENPTKNTNLVGNMLNLINKDNDAIDWILYKVCLRPGIVSKFDL